MKLKNKLNFKFNIKYLILILSLLLIVLISVYFYMIHNDTNKKNTKNLESTTSSDIYLRDSNGNKKKQLVVNNSEYTFKIDLIGDWHEYVENIIDKSKYTSFLTLNSNIETSPYFYIKIYKTDDTDEKNILNRYKKNLNNSFELISTNNNSSQYVFTYKSNRVVNNINLITKNYCVIKFINGYEIDATYSAVEDKFADDKGYIDDMINSIQFYT